MGRSRVANSTDFNLRHLVREVLDSSAVNDPHLIAPDVLDRIDDTDLRAALGECLPSFVREMIRSSRTFLTLHSQPDVMTESPGGVPRPVMKAEPVRRSGLSSKVAAIRESGPKWLSERLNTGASPREWKRVGDCGFSDLMFAAGQRREQAARTSAVADRLEALAELVQSHGVSRVRDLPASVLAEVGGAGA